MRVSVCTRAQARNVSPATDSKNDLLRCTILPELALIFDVGGFLLIFRKLHAPTPCEITAGFSRPVG